MSRFGDSFESWRQLVGKHTVPTNKIVKMPRVEIAQTNAFLTNSLIQGERKKHNVPRYLGSFGN